MRRYRERERERECVGLVYGIMMGDRGVKAGGFCEAFISLFCCCKDTKNLLLLLLLLTATTFYFNLLLRF